MMPNWHFRGNCIGDQWSKDSSDTIHGMQDTQPPMGVLDSYSEHVHLGILERYAAASEEKCRHEKGERRAPEHQSIAKTLDCCAQNQCTACTYVRTHVDIGERGDNPAHKVN